MSGGQATINRGGAGSRVGTSQPGAGVKEKEEQEQIRLESISHFSSPKVGLTD